MRKLASMIMICGLLVAQSPQQTPPQNAEPSQNPGKSDITMSVTNIQAPVKVYDKETNLVTGIRNDEFHLFDNGKEQNIRVDEHFIPISMVVAIQCNGEVDAILPKINRIGNMIQPMMLGTDGEAAVIAFDHRVLVKQDFTKDPDKITAAVKGIHSGSRAAALIDAADKAEHMLRTRGKDRQKILLLISETRDQGSINKLREVLDALQIGNVAVYQVTMSRILGKLTGEPSIPRPDPFGPTMHPMPSGVPATPTTVMQTYGTEGSSAEFLPLLIEIFRDAKAIFKIPPAEVMTKGTGGAQFSFYKNHGLEDAIQRMSEELHSQYMLTYNPNNKSEGGFHQIRVEVSGHGRVTAMTKPGYWMAADFR